MKVEIASSWDKRGKADLLVVPFWEGALEAAEVGPAKRELTPLLKSGDFKGKGGETLLHYPEKGEEPRMLLLGLGKRERVTAESLRRAYSAAVRFANGKKIGAINFLFPAKAGELRREEALGACAEGILLANYLFLRLKGRPEKEEVALVARGNFIGWEKREAPLLRRLQAIVEGVFWVRELVNGNADEITPQRLAQEAKAVEKKSKLLRATIFQKKRLEEEKMGLLLAVARGADVDPCLIQLAYKGNPASKEHVVLVGKGVTYDTGGLSLKPTEGMVTMKCDMSGAATVLGAVYVAAALGLKVNVTAVAPATENAIDGKSYKPGDVYRSHSGKTVEVTNTDAEGRLILADALSFAVKELHPTCVIDLASLTGAIVVAVGEEIAGLFTKDEKLAKELLHSSEQTGEMLWRMPLYADYLEAYKSDIADLVNSAGREAGAVKAALFLQEFVGETSWAHIDFAGPCFLSKPKHYSPTKATGFGVRLLIDFLERRSAP